MYFLLDIGGTKTRISVSHDGSKLDNTEIMETSQEFNTSKEEIKRVYDKMVGTENKAEMVIIGVASPLDRNREVVVNPPNLKSWKGINIRKEFEELLTTPVRVENDAAMAALGEANYGAGKGFPLVVYMTISTGIGGARVVNGKLDVSVYSTEPGHQTIDSDGTLWSGVKELGVGGVIGTLENYAGGNSLKARYGKVPSDIEDVKVWDDEIKYISTGLVNTIVHWSPDIIVLGGGIITSGKVDISDIRSHVVELLKIYPEVPPIKKSELGELSALWGALSYTSI